MKFYQRTWFLILMGIFIPPVTIVLLWKQQKCKKTTRIVLTIILCIWTICWIATAFKPNNQTQNINHETTTQQNKEESEAEKDAEQLNRLVGKNLLEVKNKIPEIGYTPKYFHARASDEDFTDWFAGYTDEELQEWIVTEVRNINAENKTVEIVVNTAENIANDQAAEAQLKALEEKLNVSSAWIAVKSYGEAMYPYGFKLHNFVGKLAESPSDDNTWFLKAECTVTNAFNAEAKLVCEAHVTGTTNNPQIVDFVVY